MSVQQDKEALQQRQKRQRRMTAGGGKPAAPLAKPAPAKPAASPASSTTSNAADAWQQWLFPNNPAMWAFYMAAVPATDRFHTMLHAVHPRDMFPQYYPHALPPCMSPFADILRPAAAAAPLPSQQQQQQGPVSRDCSDCSSSGADSDAATSGGHLADEALNCGSETESDADSYGGCCCSDCCARYGQNDDYCSSPESQRVAPGKRITWRGAIPTADPVRRNLFPLLKKAAPPPLERPRAEDQQRP